MIGVGFPCQKLNYCQWLQPLGGQGAKGEYACAHILFCPQLWEFLYEDAKRKAKIKSVLYSA